MPWPRSRCRWPCTRVGPGRSTALRGCSLGRLARDDRGHVAVAVLAGVARRQDHEPGLVGPGGPRPRSRPNGPGRSGPGSTSAPAWRRASAGGGPACRASAGRDRVTRVRAGGPAGGCWARDEQDSLGEAGRSPGQRTCLRSTESPSWAFRGRARNGRLRATTVSWGRCQQQHEGQSTRAVIAATPEWSP